jgi:pimeloyl-ACP methyl ester carboxylesterase
LNTNASGPPSPPQDSSHGPSSDLRGALRLVIDAIIGVTDVVEALHRNISGLAPLTGPPRMGRTTGITGLVYWSIRGLSRVVGSQLDTALAKLAPLLQSSAPSLQNEAVRAALNGVIGDHLAASNNPLAISMRLRRDGRPLTLNREALEDTIPSPKTKLLVLVHGLCMSDLQWHRNEQDHGTSLARNLGYTSLNLHYNSGLHISTNGRRFTERLEQLVQEWPVPVDELVVLGHSMGGMVTRSACHYAQLEGHAWPRRLRKLVFLGTPHHGTPLERAGSWVDHLAEISSYTAPFARIGRIRSAGVKDLRYGNLLDTSWDRDESPHTAESKMPVPLPDGARCFAIAASKQQAPNRTGPRLRGDGLVPVESALGRHEDPAHSLSIPASHQRIFYGMGHFDLLSSREVYDQLHRWVAS